MAKVAEASSVLGPRLREIRLERGMSLRELARRLDLSPSSISQIETGKMQPSVRTLYAFVAEFGVTVDEVLFEQGAALAVGVLRPPAGPGLAVQRAEGRPAIALNSGVTWERLMFWADEDVEFIEATYAPGGASGPPDALVATTDTSSGTFSAALSGWLSDSTSTSSGPATRSPSHRPLLTVSATRAMSR